MQARKRINNLTPRSESPRQFRTLASFFYMFKILLYKQSVKLTSEPAIDLSLLKNVQFSAVTLAEAVEIAVLMLSDIVEKITCLYWVFV